MSKRIAVPEGQIGVVMPKQLAQELFALLLIVRKQAGGPLSRRDKFGAWASDVDHEKGVRSKVAGDVMLAMLANNVDFLI